MKAKEYLRTIQKLESETKECYGQAEYLKNAINNLSNQNAIETVEELIINLMDEAADYAIHRVHLINELLNVYKRAMAKKLRFLAVKPGQTL